jgi:hypothetical protein
MGGFVKKVAMDRIGGDKPSAPRAFLAASAAGAFTAVLTYRALRS